MLSGDAAGIAEAVGDDLGIDEVHAELLPSDKTDELKRIMDSYPGRTIYVGDGINDAPSLVLADVGIAMGAMGSDAAIEAADIVIMDDDLGKIPDAIALSRKVNGIVRENIVFALGVKFLLLILAMAGAVSMWVAVFGDVGVSVIAILNAMRCMRVPGPHRGEPKRRRCQDTLLNLDMDTFVDMTTLIAYDGGRNSDCALDKAIQRSIHYSVPLYILTVVRDMDPENPDPAVREMMEAAAKKAAAEGVQVHTIIETGVPEDVVIDVAERFKCDIVVVGRSDKSVMGKLLLGSVSKAVIDSDLDVILVSAKDRSCNSTRTVQATARM